MPDDNLDDSVSFAYIDFLHDSGVNPVRYDEHDRIESTDEQRAEFLAHVAHVIGYDIGNVIKPQLFELAYAYREQQRDRYGNGADPTPTG